MLKRALVVIVIALIGFAIYFVNYTGYFKKVEIETREYGELEFLYKEHRGAYHFIGTVIAEVEKWAHDNQQSCKRTYGEFLDDPAAVDQDRLRSRGGCVLERPLTAAPPEGFTVEKRPARRYVVARFSGSPGIGPFTVYPKAFEYIERERLKSDGPNIEIYSVSGQSVTTEYLFPVAPPPGP
jgi:AraC family transcriptional regulator